MRQGPETLELLRQVQAGELSAEEAASRLNERRPLHVVTVRVPAPLHERAKEASRLSRKSLNQFCLEAIEAAVRPPDDDSVSSSVPGANER